MIALPEGSRLDRGSGGLERLVVETPRAEAHVYLHGAQVTHFQPRTGRPVLFLSKKSGFVGGMPGKAIRGGVPISFPWFAAKAGDASAPSHGFARLVAWELVDVRRDGEERVVARLRLVANDLTRRWFPHDFACTFTVTVGGELGLELAVENAGNGPMRFEQALHTYFAVGDVRRTLLLGLESKTYVDKVAGFARKPPAAAPLGIEGETDRIYLEAPPRITIEDPVGARSIRVENAGAANTVVWNPWIDKAKAMADLGDDEWAEMICVETANVGEDALELAAGGSHTMRVTIGVGGLGPR